MIEAHCYDALLQLKSLLPVPNSKGPCRHLKTEKLWVTRGSGHFCYIIFNTCMYCFSLIMVDSGCVPFAIGDEMVAVDPVKMWRTLSFSPSPQVDIKREIIASYFLVSLWPMARISNITEKHRRNLFNQLSQLAIFRQNRNPLFFAQTKLAGCKSWRQIDWFLLL